METTQMPLMDGMDKKNVVYPSQNIIWLKKEILTCAIT